MFICGFCGVVTKPREKQVLIPVETRQVAYLNYKTDPETEETIEVVSSGSEIVKEVAACPECAAQEEQYKKHLESPPLRESES